MPLTLRFPTTEDETAVRALHEQLLADDFSFVLDEGTWPDVLEAVEHASRGENLPPGFVRADYLLAEVDGQVAGRTSIRYALTDYLLHVGYAVGPAFRRRGYATEILRQSVVRLNAAGVEACGGVLENVVQDGNGRPTRRYWIG